MIASKRCSTLTYSSFSFLASSFGRYKDLIQPGRYVHLVDRAGRSSHFWHLVYFRARLPLSKDRRLHRHDLEPKARARSADPAVRTKDVQLRSADCCIWWRAFAPREPFLCFFGESIDVHLSTSLQYASRITHHVSLFKPGPRIKMAFPAQFAIELFFSIGRMSGTTTFNLTY
jgi:hypothetical protein